MRQHAELRQGVIRIILFSLMAFFLLPGIGLLFSWHVEGTFNREFVTACLEQIDRDASLSATSKAEAREFYRTHPLSELIKGNSPDAVQLRENIYTRFSMPWQFYVVGQVTQWTLLGGLVTFLIILVLGAIALKRRQAQYGSFVLGWNLLTLACACLVIVQGILAVWLAFWLPAFFTEHYYPKIIFVIGLAVAAGIISAVVNIFKRPSEANTVHGELLTTEQAPALWAHLRALSEKLGIQPPDQIIAGIDGNFFVTEAPLRIDEQTVTGRSLFVSIPLLRLLEQREADAVFAHELAHLYGGDTTSSAALGPKLVQYSAYCAAMRENIVTHIVYYPMALYRMIFEFALQRDNREREILADRTAVDLTSSQALIVSLLKLNAYSCYRAETEDQLFGQERTFDNSIGIATLVAAGLPTYAASTRFLQDMREANIPHPFHSHPPLSERMQNVGYQVEESQYGAFVTQMPESTWVTDNPAADAIEERLWTEYEQAFAAAHEEALAYRYRPASETETAIVLKYFPPVVFQFKGERRIEITFAGLHVQEHPSMVPWDAVHNLEYKDGIGGDILLIGLTEKAMLGHKTIKVHLPGIGNQKDAFKATLGKYWHRNQVMRQSLLASEKVTAGIAESPEHPTTP